MTRSLRYLAAVLAAACGFLLVGQTPAIAGTVRTLAPSVHPWAPYPGCGDAFMVFVKSRTSRTISYKIYATNDGSLVKYLGPLGYGTFEFGVGNNFYGPFNASTTGGASSPLETDPRGSVAALTLYDNNGNIACTGDYSLN